MKSFKQHITEKRDIADINSSILRHQELALKASKKGDREAVAVHQAQIRKLRKDKVDANKVKKEYVGQALTPANQIAKKHGGKVKSIMAKDEKGKKKKYFYAEEDELDEAKEIKLAGRPFTKITSKGKNKTILFVAGGDPMSISLPMQKVIEIGKDVGLWDGKKVNKKAIDGPDAWDDFDYQVQRIGGKIMGESLSWLEDKWLGEEVISESPDASLKKKAEKTGIPFGILKQVFNRGKAAWRTGHRPGTTPDQWGHARVNSFATKSKGTWGGADKDLAAKVRGK